MRALSAVWRNIGVAFSASPSTRRRQAQRPPHTSTPHTGAAATAIRVHARAAQAQRPLHTPAREMQNGASERSSPHGHPRGRHVVATRPLPAGTVVCRSALYASALLQEHQEGTCSFCLFQPGSHMVHSHTVACTFHFQGSMEAALVHGLHC